MTAAVICTNCTGFNTWTGSNAVSEDSQLIRNKFEKAIAELRETITAGQSLRKALETLEEIYEEASLDNWDGYGAKPVTKEALFETQKLLDLLPSSVPLPDLVPEPCGEIGLEWVKNRHHIFSVSLAGHGKITYAGLYGPNETHGTEYLGDVLPTIIIENLRRLYPG